MLRTGSWKKSTIIGNVATDAYVIAYKENVDCLVKALQAEGFVTRVLRAPHQEDGLTYTATLDVLRTHMNAWIRCAGGQSMAVIVEADFVPVVGMSSERLPFPVDKADQAFGYLYACGPELYDLDDHYYARGHAGGAVGYLLTPKVAEVLIEFGTDILKKTPLDQYTPWDTALGFYLQSRGIESYIPRRMLGEHGGKPNLEHKSAGLTKTHRADVLQNKLHFLPVYAEGSILRFWLSRIHAKCYGMARLACLRYLKMNDFMRGKQKLRLTGYAFGRHLSLW